MVRASELMIGDWVYVDDTPRQVEAITKKKIGYHKDKQNDGRLYYARLCEIEPIVISPEILKHSDFARYESMPYDAYIHIDEVARLFHYWDASWVTANVVAKSVNRVICHLHEYQHICKLDGIEIDWKF